MGNDERTTSIIRRSVPSTPHWRGVAWTLSRPRGGGGTCACSLMDSMTKRQRNFCVQGGGARRARARAYLFGTR